MSRRNWLLVSVLLLPLVLAVPAVAQEARALSTRLDQILSSNQREAALLPELLPMLQNPDGGVRAKASQLVGEIGDRSAIPSLLPLLQDSVASVRQSAVKSLGLLQAREAVPDYIALLEDSSAEVAIEAASALRNVGDERAVKALTDTMVNGSSYQLRSAAVQALGQIGSPDPVSQMIVLLEYERDVWLRLELARALSKLTDDEAKRPLMRFLEEVRREGNRQIDKRRKAVYEEIGTEVERLVLALQTPKAKRAPPEAAAREQAPAAAEPSTETLNSPDSPGSQNSIDPAPPGPVQNPKFDAPSSTQDTAPVPAAPTPTIELHKPAKVRKSVATKKKAVRGLFTLQIKATPSADVANALLEDLKSKSQPAYRTEFARGGETWYRVRIGEYENPEVAELEGRTLKEKGVIEEYFVTKHE